MNKLFANISSLIPKNSIDDMIVPDGIKSKISNAGVRRLEVFCHGGFYC